MNVALIGYRAAGKTTLGVRLAEALGWSFVDTDDLVEDRAGRTIAEIFREGEAGFRDLEAAVVAEVVGRDRTVIACGGGVVLRPSNVAALRDRSLVVWLVADARTIAGRIEADPGTALRRPALAGKDPVSEVETVLAGRLALYREAADLQIDTVQTPPGEAVLEIRDAVESPPERLRSR